MKKIWALIIALSMCISVLPMQIVVAEENITFTALDGTANNDTQNQGYAKLLDGSIGSKWCDRIGTVDGTEYIPYIIFKASQPVIITDYTFVTGNDSKEQPGRNPKDWTLYGCNDYNEANKFGGTWTAIHTVVNDEVMQNQNYASFKFTIENNSGMYKYYKLVIMSNHGAEYNLMQLSEMRINFRLAYNVTFDKNGGDTEASPKVIVSGSGLPTKNPTRSGYEFEGWYTKNGADGDWGESFTEQSLVSADTTVYAKWKEYQITYSMNDGSGSNYSVSGYSSGFPEAKPERTGLKFIGWYTQNGADGDWGMRFTEQSAVSGDITVYARWIEPVMFEVIGGTEGNVTNEINEGYGNLFDGKNSGDTFTKWCVHGNNGHLIIKAQRPIELSSYTFITGNDNAQYKGRSPKTWTLSGCNDYNSEDSTSGTWEQITSVTDDTTINDMNFTTYTFEANAEQAYMYYKLDIVKNSGGNVLQLCGLDFDYDVSEEYAGTLVYFDKNGGTTVPFPQVMAVGEGLPTVNPTKNGYSFAGWYTQNGADGSWGDSFTEQSTVSADSTVYAKWTAYTVTYNMNDGSENNHAVLPYGNTPENPVKSGRDFEGWYTKNGADGDWGVEFTAQTTVTGNITVYAKWGNVKVTFDKNGGDTASVPTVMEHGSGIPTTNPTRNGYSFDGWYTKNGEDDDWGVEYTSNTELGANTTVYARWQEYRITFKMNDGSDLDYGIFGYGNVFPLPMPKKKNANVSGWYMADGTDGNWGSLFSASTAVTSDTSVYAKWEASHTHCICGADHTAVNGHTSEMLATYTPIGTIDELYAAASGTAEEPRYYYLTADIEIPYRVSSGGTISYTVFAKDNFVLCLNGHKLSHAYAAAPITVYGNFTLTDCVGTGMITHNDESKNSYGVYIDGGMFNMYNGKITKNVSNGGGGIYMRCGTFNMYGGTISENKATSQYGGGGGVATSDGVGFSGATVNIYGGKIINNTSAWVGGGVFVNGNKNKLNIFGGEISGNTAEGSDGGGIYCNSASTVNIENAVISENSALSADGGGIAIISVGNATVKNSTIRKNSANSGGGIYIWTSGGEIDNCTISENTATRHGGGVYTISDNWIVKNSSICDNKTTDNGGGVFVGRKGKIENTNVLRNEASNGGGIFYSISASEPCTVSNCKIADNKTVGTEGKGGGIRIYGGEINVQDGTEITANSANVGGGIYIDGGDSLNLQNVRISENTVKVKGGGVYSKEDNGLIANGGVYIYDNLLLDEAAEGTGEEQETSAQFSDEQNSGESEEAGSEEGAGSAGESSVVTGKQNNLFLAIYTYSTFSKIKLTAAELVTDTGYVDTKIGITLEDITKVFTEACETNYSACFVSDDLNYAVKYSDNVLKLAEAYTVTFDYGTYSEKVSVVKNTPVRRPKGEPSMEGKTFIGWFIGDEEYDFTKEVLRNITVSAKWFDETNIGISMNKDKIYANVPEIGAVLYIVLYKNFEQTDTIRRELTENTILNMQELGISKDNVDKLSVVLLDSNDNPICDEAWLSLNIPIFDITFDRNGGNSDPEPKTLKSDKGMPNVNPTKSGYTFMGWYTKNGTDGDWGEEYTFDTVVTSDLTVYAKWKKNLESLAFEVVSYSGRATNTWENAEKLVDGKKTVENGSKWCVNVQGSFAEGNTIYAVLKSPESIKVSGYTLITGNDTQQYSERNPKSWKIYGCNDFSTYSNEGTWVELASVTDDTLLPAENYASVHYDITNNDTYYTYYKFEVSAIGSDTTMQLSELEFNYDECEHVWNFMSAVQETCLTEGCETRKCALCGLEEKTVVSPPLGHNSENNGNCSRCGKLAEVEINNVKYSDFKEAFATIADNGGTIKLIKDVELDGGVIVSNDVTITLDLNGYVLRTINSSRAIEMNEGTLNITDSRPETVNKLDTTNEPWVKAADNATGDNIKTYSGGIITGAGVEMWGEATNSLNISGGTFAGCRINSSGGAIYSYGVPIVMSGNAAIRDCKGADSHAIHMLYANMTMKDNAIIADCGRDVYYSERIIYFAGDNTFTMEGSASIENCISDRNYAIYSNKQATLKANTSGIIDGMVSFNNITCDDDCPSTTIFKKNVEANSISAGLFYGNVSGTINNCTVTYKMSDEENAATYAINVVKSGNKALKPINPTTNGKSFIDWKKDGVAYDFNSTITSDIILTADWLSGDVDSEEKLYRALENNISPIKLINDITVSNTINVSYPLVVDLNGYLLKYEGETEGSYLFNVPENIDLTIKNSKSSRTYRVDKTNEKWVIAESNATGNNIEVWNGGIVIGNIKNNGILTVNDCLFTGTDGIEGVINNAGELVMQKSTIMGCSGIFINNSGIFNIMDGTLINSNNASTDKVINTGTIYAYGGMISASMNNSGTITSSSNSKKFLVYNNVKNTGTISWGIYYDGITNSGEGKIEGCKVQFIISGEEYALEVLPSGKCVIVPSIPANLEYSFAGWYMDSEFTQEWITDDDVVTEDITLYAKTLSGDVSTADDLHAVVDAGIPQIKLLADIEVDEALYIDSDIILDLNGHVLRFVSTNGYTDNVIYIEGGSSLHIKDSNPRAEHKFDTSEDLWVLAEDTATGEHIKTIYGGVITGGMGYEYDGDNVYYGGGIGNDGELAMQGGNIIGCSATVGGGILNSGYIEMENVCIAGCVATIGGGIHNEDAIEMRNVHVLYCTGVEYGSEEYENYQPAFGGGIYSTGQLVMLESTVQYCNAMLGGGIYQDNSSGIAMLLETMVSDCEAMVGGGIMNLSTFGFFESTVKKCKATEYADGICNAGELYFNGDIKECTSNNSTVLYNYNKLNACGGTIDGNVYNNYQIYADFDSMGSLGEEKETVFNGKVTNAGQIMDGIYYGGIENITVTEEESSRTGTIESPAVTYMNGQAVYAIYVTSNANNAILPVAPVKANSTFEGWYKGDEEYGFNEAVTKNITLTAKWSGEGVEASASLEMTPNVISVISGGENATLYVAAYKQGRLVCMTSRAITNDLNIAISSLGLDISNADELRAFLWDDMKPLCTAEQMLTDGSQAEESLSMADGTVYIVIDNSDATLYVASYKNEALIDVALKAITERGSAELSELDLELCGADKVKAFLWDDNMQPICKAAEMRLK